MIEKIINGYDIHINGQQLRIIEKSDLKYNNDSIDYKTLLFREPRGNKYVNLLIYDIQEKYIEIELYSYLTINNKEVLIKSFIQSLIDRGKISGYNQINIKINNHIESYNINNLGFVEFYKVQKENDFYRVNNQTMTLLNVDFSIRIEDIENIKSYINKLDIQSDYVILMNSNKIIVVDNEKNIIAYPTIESLSLMSELQQEGSFEFINGSQIEIKSEYYFFKYYLISNSQFYFDNTDIYSDGFIIK